MDVIDTIYSLKKIKFYLIFFCLVTLFSSCENDLKDVPIQIKYMHGKAISADFSYDNNPEKLKICLEKNPAIPILGNFEKFGINQYSFRPLIPFTRGQTYVLQVEKKLLGKFTVTNDTLIKPPEILAIYPSTDTVPENLLKLYIKFSQPMQQVGQVLDFIKVVNKNEGKEKDIFLELEAELWNRQHDLLTLWLDPGRIKTNLIPNKEQGLPLLEKNTYTIHIDSSWNSANGIPIGRSFSKSLVVTERDNQKPSVSDWKLTLPNVNTKNALSILFSEPMDAVLSTESISIYDDNETPIPGNFDLSQNEIELLFAPDANWKSGRYEIKIASLFEDLAGNNLNRLFDENLTHTSNKKGSSQVHILEFRID